MAAHSEGSVPARSSPQAGGSGATHVSCSIFQSPSLVSRGGLAHAVKQRHVLQKHGAGQDCKADARVPVMLFA